MQRNADERCLTFSQSVNRLRYFKFVRYSPPHYFFLSPKLLFGCLGIGIEWPKNMGLHIFSV